MPAAALGDSLVARLTDLYAAKVNPDRDRGELELRAVRRDRDSSVS